jgi:hypothetical protein
MLHPTYVEMHTIENIKRQIYFYFFNILIEHIQDTIAKEKYKRGKKRKLQMAGSAFC